MRLKHAIFNDLRFMYKQGFFLVYGVVTLMYMLILSYVPDAYRSIVVPMVIFSDPAVLGLFFIGGIVMLEKMQGVIVVSVVTPLRITEYVHAKLVALTSLSVVASLLLAIVSGCTFNILVFVLTVVLSSCFFTLCGIIITASCEGVNSYFMRTIPIMILLCLPCALLFVPGCEWCAVLVPSVALGGLLLGAFCGQPLWWTVGLLFYATIVTYLLYRYTIDVFERKIVYNE